MAGHKDRAHALLSASGAHRWMNCTPSAVLESQFPDTTSEAAKEGNTPCPRDGGGEVTAPIQHAGLPQGNSDSNAQQNKEERVISARDGRLLHRRLRCIHP